MTNSRKFQVKNAALLVIDMQRCFLNGSIKIPSVLGRISNINKLASHCRENNIPVVWVRMKYDETGLWKYFQDGKVLSSNSPEFQLFEEMDVAKSDYILDKTRYSAFIESHLDTLLKELGCDTVIITGVATNICCESTARDAMMMDYKVIFVGDATAALSNVLHQTSLENIQSFFGDVVTTEEIIQELIQSSLINQLSK